MAATSVFHRVRTGSNIGAQYDQDGNLIQVCTSHNETLDVSQVETREDEEQSVKLAETLELLLAAGYFRARIKGLSPFDKVVGGMTWCITTCNFDIDVDLLFQENSTIGQKIALTEKIVSVLPKMTCPHRLEPHQIQGLDFIHIFPVIQWLVKRAIETREEMGDYVRAYSISQFQKTHSLPEDEEFLQRKGEAARTVLDVLSRSVLSARGERLKPLSPVINMFNMFNVSVTANRPHFLCFSPDGCTGCFGRYGFSKQSKQDTVDERKTTLASGAPPAASGTAELSEEDQLQAVEEMRIKALMTSMAAMANEEGKLTASAVGQIVGLQSEEIKQIVSEYAEKQSELSSSASEERSERFGPLQQHRRAVASLNKQIQQKTTQLQEVGWDSESAPVAGQGLLEKLRALVTTNESLKQQEQEFRTHCREEMARLQQNIEELKVASGQDTEEEKERNQLIDKQYNTDREKLQKIRLLMARRNREIAVLQRKMDEVPSRAELTQYQKRFIELYSQVSATHKETKQFFTLYNTLHDKKVYLEKEVRPPQTTSDHVMEVQRGFTLRAMASSAAKEQFLRQMEQIVEGIKQNRIKLALWVFWLCSVSDDRTCSARLKAAHYHKSHDGPEGNILCITKNFKSPVGDAQRGQISTCSRTRTRARLSPVT
ncbi:Coiled-coil domain-containing protein 93 [Liparis tanakae]|uniref:Coiled-coil domain-containing protein 93 n=1 Tax=Liparis tanakae TaxID=230148 RepID=A0A4Z2GSR8_9TELE|nr:Coiled-coil domain-containing protein 93 [Liparis tanakae]